MQRERRAPFTKAEDAAMLEIYKNNKETIDSPLCSKVTKCDKDAVWQEIADATCALGVEKRTPDECRKRFKNIKQNAKIKAALERNSMLKTGGGEGVFMSQAEAEVADMFAEDPAFVGLRGVEAGMTSKQAAAIPKSANLMGAKVKESTALTIPRELSGCASSSKEIGGESTKPKVDPMTIRKTTSIGLLQERVLKRQLQLANVQLTYYRAKLRHLTVCIIFSAAMRQDFMVKLD